MTTFHAPKSQRRFRFPDQNANTGSNIVVPAYPPHLPSLLLGVVIPLDLLVLQHLGYLDEAAEMDALAVRHHHLLLQHAGVADVVRVVAHVLAKVGTGREKDRAVRL